MTITDWPAPEQTRIATLAAATRPSPLQARGEPFVDDAEGILLSARLADMAAGGAPPAAFELAGPRERIFHDPATLGCGIITCGGLCPGLNNVVRSIVLRLWYAYGVRRILGPGVDLHLIVAVLEDLEGEIVAGVVIVGFLDHLDAGGLGFLHQSLCHLDGTVAR